MYMGTASLALKSGADIIPMAIEQYENVFYVNIGENIDSSPWRDEQIPNLTEYLREQILLIPCRMFMRRSIVRRNR